jgi:hypothetical protein
MAAVVTYVRPFTQHDRHPRATSTVTSPSKTLPVEERALQGKLVSMRNQVLAHSSFNMRPAERTGGSSTGWSASAQVFYILESGLDLALFRSLCQRQIDHCMNRLNELNAMLDPIIDSDA